MPMPVAATLLKPVDQLSTSPDSASRGLRRFAGFRRLSSIFAIGSMLLLTGCAVDETTTSTAVQDAAEVAADSQPGSQDDAVASPDSSAGEKSPETRTATNGSALAMLYELDVKGRAPQTGYDRDLFGWRDDVDHNGCDTRNDVLRRDLHDIALRPGGCVVLGGTLTSDYTGDTFDFIRGEGNNIDIDHVVALSNAWQTGAQQLSESERNRFANDPINLLAVESSVNRQKSDADAATWLPPLKSYRCEYVARQIAVKHSYDLWVVQPEFDAMERQLKNCDENAFGKDPWPGRDAGDTAPTSAPKPAPQREDDATGSDNDSHRSGSGSGSGGSSSESNHDSDSSRGSSGPGTGAGGAYKNCTEARERGGAPVKRGDSGYGSHLDRDNDGVGCE